MKIRQIVVACIALLGLMLTWSKTVQTEPPLRPDQIMSASKSFSSIDKHVFVQGRWKRTGGNMKLNIPSRINTISITCDKNSMTCKEIIASADKWGTSYIAPVKRENEKISSFVKTASYKTVLILGTLLF
jgi:hypothetical protein